MPLVLRCKNECIVKATLEPNGPMDGNGPKGQRQEKGRRASSQASGPEIGPSRGRTWGSVTRNSARHPLSSKMQSAKGYIVCAPP